MDFEGNDSIVFCEGTEELNDIITVDGGEYEQVEIEVYFDYIGSCSQGKLYGPPEHCYPAEYEDERTVTDILIGELNFTKHDKVFQSLIERLNIQNLIEEPELAS